MRQRALASALVLSLLGCASSKPGGQSSNDAGGSGGGGSGGNGGGGAAGRDAAPSTDTPAGSDAPADMPITSDAPADMPVTSDAPADMAPPSNDTRTDVPATSDAPTDTSSPADRTMFDALPSDPLPPAPGKVYAHSAETLYLLEPISKQVTMVGTFDCTGSMVDIAIDKAGKMTGSAAISFNGALGGALVTVEAATARCTVLSRGPNLLTSLTYVPEGTLLATAEALVGYADDRYVRVDPATGTLTDVGLLNNAASGGTRWLSSGDVVSIKGGGTYLTVKAENGDAGGRGDRIVEVDPKTGGLLRIIGATGQDDVLGLGYWGGIAYGFTIAGKLIQIDLTTGAGTLIPIPAAPAELSFLGAGTTTLAPIIFE
jgi:hypothetical protein